MSIFDFLSKNNTIDMYPKKGFDFSYLSDNYIYIRNNKYYNLDTAKNCLKILKECANLINTTKKPEIFFRRYLLALSILNELIPVERKFPFKGDKPSKIKKEFYQKEILTVNDFIDRYYNDTLLKITSLKTEKSKIARINEFHSSLDTYKQYMSAESINKYNELYLKLKTANNSKNRIKHTYHLSCTLTIKWKHILAFCKNFLQ